MFLVRPQAASSDSLVHRHEMMNLRPREIMSPREIISRVDNLFSEKNEARLQNPVQIFELGILYGGLEFKCKEIRAETTGIWGFFRHLFNSSAVTEEKLILDEMQRKCLFIQNVVEAMPRLENIQMRKYSNKI